ncbi:MAG: hypothetical protein HYU39_07390 [Thaumarchaeota archaeon]|nr:hypothetical protein [Nitrososphaerota archaeon]
MDIQLGRADLAKYPFLSQAGEHAKAFDLDLSDLGSAEYAPVAERAKERVLEAVRKGKVSDNLVNPDVELLSFPLAMVLVKATGLEHLASRYALSEALRVEGLLEKETNINVIAYIFRNALKVELEEASDGPQGHGFAIRFSEYLKRSTQFHEPEWKLINRPVSKGRVYLAKHDLVRLIRAEIRRMIYQRLKSLTVPRLPPLLDQFVKEITARTPPPRRVEDVIPVSPDMYPPCVKHALDMLKNGQDPPHFARFLMTTYLLNIGKSVDDVIGIFPRAADFNERVTRYQVEHLAGIRGGKVKYRVPSCKNVVSHSFCFRDSVYCPNIVNPVQYGRRPPAVKKVKKSNA